MQDARSTELSLIKNSLVRLSYMVVSDSPLAEYATYFFIL